jgi:hypothetical protein
MIVNGGETTSIADGGRFEKLPHSTEVPDLFKDFENCFLQSQTWFFTSAHCFVGMDVTAVAKGNVEILASSGFPYTQPKRTSPPMDEPAPPKVALGVNNGDIM